MSLKRIAAGCVFSAALVAGGVAIAQHPPVENVGRRHANIDAAQHLVDQAYARISAAQQANEWDMAGHAAHAKDLLDQANRELKAAAMTANRR